MPDMNPVNLTSGPPETVLPAEPFEALEALREALADAADDQRSSVGTVACRWPTFLDAWARLGDRADDDAGAYAAYRVGYHRGLDKLRQSGWRGSGYVRWEHETNRGFLRSLAGLQRVAAKIGEGDEADRCRHFLVQLDPSWPPTDLG